MNELVYDPRTNIRVPPNCDDPNKQCASVDRGYFCTAVAGHRGWHTAYGTDPSMGTLHIWLDPGAPE